MIKLIQLLEAKGSGILCCGSHTVHFMLVARRLFPFIVGCDSLSLLATAP